MRSFSIATAVAFTLVLLLGGCVRPPPEDAAPPGHPDQIVVREFTFSPGVVMLDPSLGFSLYRGEPGVSPTRRAESVGRAAAFSLADAVTQELTRDGYDVVHVETGSPETGGRALIVNGAFRRVFEGHRHAGASVAVAVAIDYQAGGGSAPLQRLSAFDLDSRRLALSRDLAPGRRGDDVNYETSRLGAAIGRYVANLARTSRWPTAAAAGNATAPP